jgi:phosphate transport system substrate-binding protein
MILTDEPGAKSWPIAGATFILVPKQPKDAAAAKEALKFFEWAYKNGDEMASSLDYIPMPDSVVSLIQAKWKSEIKDGAGKPVF